MNAITMVQIALAALFVVAVAWFIYQDETGRRRRPCERCVHRWRQDGEDVCGRLFRDENAPTTEAERDDGFVWSLFFRSCGERGRYFVERMRSPSTPSRSSAQSEDVQ